MNIVPRLLERVDSARLPKFLPLSFLRELGRRDQRQNAATQKTFRFKFRLEEGIFNLKFPDSVLDLSICD